MAEHRVCMQDGGQETELDFDEEYVTGSDVQRFRRQVETLTPKQSATRSDGHKCFGAWNLTSVLFCLRCNQSGRRRSVVLSLEWQRAARVRRAERPNGGFPSRASACTRCAWLCMSMRGLKWWSIQPAFTCSLVSQLSPHLCLCGTWDDQEPGFNDLGQMVQSLLNEA